jgi:hypothetical protein
MSDQIRSAAKNDPSGGVPSRSYEVSSAGGQKPDPETDQFNYDTPYDGGSVSDRAGIEAAKEGKLVADKNDVERAAQNESEQDPPPQTKKE